MPGVPGSPAVVPPYTPTRILVMTKDIQLMSFDLMKHFCKLITPSRWRIAHTYNFAMNNGAEHGYDGGIAHPDYINNMDVNAITPAAYDKMQRTFEGSFITGELLSNLIWCEPGRDAIDARGFSYIPGTPEAAVTLQEIIDKHRYSCAVGVGKDVPYNPYRMREQWLATNEFVVFPFILDRPVAYESKFFVPWDETYYPDPLKVYL
jgi:hypothetical protein